MGRPLSANEAAALIRSLNGVKPKEARLKPVSKAHHDKDICRLNWARIMADRRDYLTSSGYKMTALVAFAMAVRTDKARIGETKFYGHLNRVLIDIDLKDTHKMNKKKPTAVKTTIAETKEEVKKETQEVEVEATAKEAPAKTAAPLATAVDEIDGYAKDLYPSLKTMLSTIKAPILALQKASKKDLVALQAQMERDYKLNMALISAMMLYLDSLPAPAKTSNEITFESISKMSLADLRTWVIESLKAPLDDAIKLNTDKIPDFNTLQDFCLFASRPDAQQPAHFAALISLLGDYLKKDPEMPDYLKLLASLIVSSDVRVLYQRSADGTALDTTQEPDILVNI